MSDIRFNQWLHSSGTGGVSQVDGGHVGIGTTNPLIPVGSGNTSILNVGVVTANSYYGDGSNLSGIVGGGTSLSFNDNIGAYFGNSQDLKIYHDGNHSYIDDQGTGNLRFRSGTLEISNLAGNKTSATFSSGGGQTLNFNNSQRFVTTNTGAVVTGILTATASLNVKQSGNALLNLLSTGSGNAGIYMDASNGDIAGSDYCFIGQDNNLDLVIQANANAGNIDFKRASNTNVRITSTGRLNIGDADQSQNVDQFSVTLAAQNTLDNVARFQSAAAASGTSESLVKIYKGAGYGGVISGYITQGSDHGMKFYTADNGSLTERLRISKLGITKPSNPAFHARPPSNYTIPNNGIIGGTWSTSDSESFVRGTLANGNSIWDNSTGIFTVPVTGIYYIHWSVFLTNNTTRRDAFIYRGNDIIARTEIGDPEGTTGNNKNVSVSTVVSLSVNDEIKFAALTTGGTTTYSTAKPWSYACGYLIG